MLTHNIVYSAFLKDKTLPAHLVVMHKLLPSMKLLNILYDIIFRFKYKVYIKHECISCLDLVPSLKYLIVFIQMF